MEIAERTTRLKLHFLFEMASYYQDKQFAGGDSDKFINKFLVQNSETYQELADLRSKVGSSLEEEAAQGLT